MAMLDLNPTFCTPAAGRGALASILVAAALIVVLGVPALMAPGSQAPLTEWHGNSASPRSLR
ncbi:hypothetical protein [Phaeobacter gallaeciensis]|uniref:hypothetical protein n=1 Tax=Phaeobacter gallaeciensis TaxID=60890 RepID=UPI000BBB7DC9|nr:hypothetical protein [Phaeobacter gallaeciensis]ATF18619.1 hypothetical protein PhaeoP129_01993 [Phaeobacter gallaeciensis]ATF22728.1 hypothetical protein PhaeoP128_01993 [Phaeobacter gallaeciensis]